MGQRGRARTSSQARCPSRATSPRTGWPSAMFRGSSSCTSGPPTCSSYAKAEACAHSGYHAACCATQSGRRRQYRGGARRRRAEPIQPASCAPERSVCRGRVASGGAAGAARALRRVVASAWVRIAAVGVLRQRTRHPWLPAVRALPKLEPATTLGTGGRKAEGGLPEKTEQNLQQARGKGHSLYLPLVLFVLLLDPDSVFAPCISRLERSTTRGSTP
jgi:hypothetical protein